MVSKLFKVETILGIGIGFILSALLVGLFPLEKPLTNKEIMQQARDLGMVTEEEHKKLLKKELDKITGKSNVAELSPVGTKADEADTEPKNAEPKNTEPKNTEPKNTEPKNTEPSGNEAKNTVRVTIPKGANSEKIAKILIAAGVKTDAQSFQKAVDQLRAQRRFQVGNFIVPTDGDIKDVIEILTKLPNA